MTTVYVMRAKGTNLCKIGFTSGDVEERRRALQTGCPHELIVELTFAGNQEDERRAHRIHRERRLVGEWFQLDAAGAASLALDVADRRHEAWARAEGERLVALRNEFDQAFGPHDEPTGLRYRPASIRLFCEAVSGTAFDPRLNGDSDRCLHCDASPGGDEVGADNNFGHAPGCPIPWLERAAQEMRRGRE